MDESWKHSVEKEKNTGAVPQEPEPSNTEADFPGFVSTLAMQTLVALGEIPHPQTGQPHPDLPQARYLIDVIQLLSDKTKGNLSVEEAAELKTLLYELRVKFVKKSQEVPE